jgi:hypothetical protein
MLRKRQRPRLSQELIFLDPDDDLGTIRAKLESSPAEEIYLVVPQRASTLRTPLEYRILARMAHELSTDVTVVSTDSGRRYLARQEGLRVRRGYGGVRHLAEAAGAPRSWIPSVPDWVPLPSLTAVLVLALLAALLAGFVLVALPVLQVSVTPVSENIQRELELTVDPGQRSADPERAVLPGETMQYRFEVAGSLPTTGQRNVGRDPARGEVVFTNNTPNPVVLPSRSVIVARNGARFLSDSEVRVNAFSFGLTRVSVTAEQRGTAGNIEANQVVTLDPPIERFMVANPRPMTGGTDRQAKAVAAADQAKLKELLLQRAREQALAEFASRGGQGKSIPQEALQLRVENESYQPAVEAEADQLAGNMNVAATAVGWENQAFNSLVQAVLLSRFGPQYDLPLSQLRMPPPEVVEARNQRLRLKVRADAVVVHGVNPDPIESELRGKSPNEATSILRRLPGLAGSPRVEISPSWAPRAYRVEVSIASPK